MPALLELLLFFLFVADPVKFKLPNQVQDVGLTVYGVHAIHPTLITVTKIYTRSRKIHSHLYIIYSDKIRPLWIVFNKASYTTAFL